MKETTIKVEKTVKYVEKEELITLGYHEISTDGMLKDYPTGETEVGYVIFEKISDPDIKGGYWNGRNFMSLHPYTMDDDPKELLQKK